MKSLGQIAWETIHRTDKSVETLADEIGCSASLIYKAANPNEPVDIKLSWLIPLMRATGNYSILKHLAYRCGYVAIRIPRARRMKPSEYAEHQARISEYMFQLSRYLEGKIDKDECLESVKAALEQVAMAQRMVEADTGQTSMFDEAEPQPMSADKRSANDRR